MSGLNRIDCLDHLALESREVVPSLRHTGRPGVIYTREEIFISPFVHLVMRSEYTRTESAGSIPGCMKHV